MGRLTDWRGRLVGCMSTKTFVPVAAPASPAGRRPLYLPSGQFNTENLNDWQHACMCAALLRAALCGGACMSCWWS